MTEEEEKKVNELLQYDMMGEPTPQTSGWGTFQGMNTQTIMEPVIPNPAPEGA